VAEMRRQAEAGDGAAMFMLGNWYLHGQKGLAKDHAKAFEWLSKSHEAGDASGTGELGGCYSLAGASRSARCERTRSCPRQQSQAAKWRAPTWATATPTASKAFPRTSSWRAATTRWWPLPPSRICLTPSLRWPQCERQTSGFFSELGSLG